MTAHPVVIAARFGLGALTWLAIVIQCGRHVDAGFPLINFVSYFTILANGIGGAVLLAGAWLGLRRKAPPAWYDRVRGAATLYLSVVGLVFVTLLRDADLGNLLPWINTVHHYVLPMAVMAEWLIVPPVRSFGTRDLFAFLVFPLAYITYTLLRGAGENWYPYPFLNPAIVGGYGIVMLYVAGMVATFVVMGWGLRRTGDRVVQARGPS